MALNQITIHPRALRVVSQLLDTPEENLRLSQSHVIAKLGRLLDPGAEPGSGRYQQLAHDQNIHVDYGNNTLLVPPRTRPEAVACLAYYCEVRGRLECALQATLSCYQTCSR